MKGFSYMYHSRLVSFLTITMLAVAFAATAHGPVAAGPGVATAQAAPAKIAPKQLKSFVSAAKQVFKIREKFAPQVQAAGNEEAARTLITAAQGEMRKAIEGAGLTIERYNEIIQAAQADPALASEIQGMMDKPK